MKKALFFSLSLLMSSCTVFAPPIQQGVTLWQLVSQIGGVVDGSQSLIDALETITNRIESKVNDNIARVDMVRQAVTTALTQLFGQIIQIEDGLEDLISRIDGVVENSTACVCSKLDVLQETLEEGFGDSQISQAKIFSKLDTIEASLSAGITKLCSQIDTVCAVRSPLLKKEQPSQNSPLVIDKPGYYTLDYARAFDHDAAVVIKADNVVLDLQGLCIDGTKAGKNGVCVVVNECANVTVKNGVLTGAYGMILHKVHDVTVSNVLCTKTAGNGFIVDASSSVTFDNCTALHVENGSGFVCVNNSKAIAMNNCVARSCAKHGINILSVDHSVVRNCVAQDNGESGIACDSAKHIQLSNNTAEGNGSNGMLITSNTKAAQVMGNTILGNGTIGLCNEGAKKSVFASNVATANATNYQGVSSVSLSKATSHWKNVHA